MTIGPGTLVSLRLQVLGPDGGAIFNGPLAYHHGQQPRLPMLAQVLPLAMEEALSGQAAGARIEREIAEAFGPWKPEALVRVARSKVPAEVQVGEVLQAGRLKLPVHAVDAEHVVLDGNHPLAGQTVKFLIEVLSVKPRGRR